MKNKLPKNWVECSLGDIFEIVTGNTPSKSFPEYYGENIPWVKPGDINKSTEIFYTDEFLSKEGFEKSRKIPKGSVMVTCIGNLGNVAIAGTELATNQQINSIVISHDFINKKYVYYRSLTFKKWLVENSTSTTISMVNKSNFEKLTFLLPPLAEQNRIVAKLDALFAQHEAIKTSMAKIPELLKNFRQQVLTQAVTGKLTEEWRKGKELGEWKFEEANECCEKVQSGGTPKGSNFSVSGIPFLKVYNIVNNKVDFEYKPQYVTKEIQNSQIKKSITYPNDIIMNIVGPPLNKVAIVPNDYPEWNLNQAITLFRVKNYLLNNFLFYFFCEGSSVKSLVNETKGVVGQVNISLSQCREFQIPIPPLEEQQEIVNRVESLFAKAAVIEQQYQKIKTKIDTLPQAILNKAFKGELTEQLDSDGDAKALLKQIKALQAATGKTIKSKKKPATKKVKLYPENEGVLDEVAEGNVSYKNKKNGTNNF